LRRLPFTTANIFISSRRSSLPPLTQLLHWHKLANEAALKAALIRTKKMKKLDSVNPPKETLQEKAEWMQQIIEEEQAKPLQVGKDYILKYEEEEKRNEAALQKQVEHHVTCLKNLKDTIDKRAQIKAKKQQFKDFKEQVNAERKAVLEGKISAQQRFRVDKNQTFGGEGSGEGQKTQGALATVIGSLDKLVDLEKRISSLESDNLLDRVKEGSSVPQQKLAKMKLAFSKKRSEPKPGVPAKAYYSVRVQQGKKGGKARGVRGTMKGLGRAGRNKDQKARTTGGGGAFLTQKKMGRSNPYLSSTSGVARGGGRSAVAARSKPSTLRERREQHKVKRDNERVRKERMRGRGASGGVKMSTVSMARFEDIRKQQRGRIEQIKRGGKPGMGTHGRKAGGGMGDTGVRGVRGAGARSGGRGVNNRVNRTGRMGAGAPRGVRTGGRSVGARTGGRPRPAPRGKVGGYKTVTGASRNTGPKPRGASRFPSVKGATTGGIRGRAGGSGLKAVRANRAKAARKAW